MVHFTSVNNTNSVYASFKMHGTANIRSRKEAKNTLPLASALAGGITASVSSYLLTRKYFLKKPIINKPFLSVLPGFALGGALMGYLRGEIINRSHRIKQDTRDNMSKWLLLISTAIGITSGTATVISSKFLNISKNIVSNVDGLIQKLPLSITKQSKIPVKPIVIALFGLGGLLTGLIQSFIVKSLPQKGFPKLTTDILHAEKKGKQRNQN